MNIWLTVSSASAFAVIAAASPARSADSATPSKQVAMANLSSQPLAFIENRGQWGKKTIFRADAGGATFYFCREEVALLFVRNGDNFEGASLPEPDEIPGQSEGTDNREALLIKTKFAGANPQAVVSGDGMLSQYCNYFYGNDPSKWRTHVPNFSSVVYRDIWPGIDIRYRGNGRAMKYDFIVHPGADLSAISLQYEGVEDLYVTPSGELCVQSKFGPIFEKMPRVYQESGHGQENLEARFVPNGRLACGFDVGDYDRSCDLIIDPEIVFSTYLGGSLEDNGQEVAITSNGEVVVTGYTISNDFPTVDPYDGSLGGVRDAFVTEYSRSGDVLFSTYYGGLGIDWAYDVAVDIYDNIYLAGSTTSSDFPRVNPYDNILGGSQDAFLSKFSSAGDSLIYSTYLGGSAADRARALAVDDLGCAYFGGWTMSTDFPLVNAFDFTHPGTDLECFITKFVAVGDSLVYSSYLGGLSDEWILAIAVDSAHNAFLTGLTSSSDFPMANAYDDTLDGIGDGFIAKLSISGSTLLSCTFLGGSGDDYCTGIAVDLYGRTHVTGGTSSSDFPTLNPYDGILNGQDAFLTIFNGIGGGIGALSASTFFGGSALDNGSDIVLDPTGKILITGTTVNASDFPLLNPIDGAIDTTEAFLVQFSYTGQDLLFGSFIGGNAAEDGNGIAVDSWGMPTVVGATASSMNFPFANAADSSLGGTMDAFVAKIKGLVPLPEIVSYSPAANAIGIKVDSIISVSFNIPMEVVGDIQYVSVSGNQRGRYSGEQIYDPDRNEITFIHPNFNKGEIITVTLVSTIRSLDGLRLENGLSWSFTTEVDPAIADFDLTIFIPADSGVYSVVAADFDGDTDNDLAGAMTDADAIATFQNQGQGLILPQDNYQVGDQPRTVVAADINDDDRPDLVSANSGSNSISILLNFGDGTFPATPSATLQPGGPAYGLACADFDGDGDIDIAATTGTSGTVVIFENAGGIFPTSPGQVGSTGEGAYGLFVADLNLDFFPDLIVTTGDSTSVKAFTNDGDGGIPPTPSGSYDTEGSSWGLFSSDFDRDGYADLAIANLGQHKLSILLNAGDGSYPTVFGSYDTPGSAWGLFGADFDGDGDIDLAVSSPELGVVTVFLNYGNGAFHLFGSYDTEGSAWGVFAADLDGDGTVDMAVGNSESDGVTVLFNAPAGPGCAYITGDINGNGSANGIDVVYGVAYLKGGNAPITNCNPPCTGQPNPFFAAMDVNGNCMANGIDITYFVSYLKGIQPALLHCLECPPSGR